MKNWVEELGVEELENWGSGLRFCDSQSFAAQVVPNDLRRQLTGVALSRSFRRAASCRRLRADGLMPIISDSSFMLAPIAVQSGLAFPLP
jgi:hypothetical protein